MTLDTGPVRAELSLAQCSLQTPDSTHSNLKVTTNQEHSSFSRIMESDEEERRPRLAAVVEDLQDQVSTCCFDFFDRNKIVPSIISENAEDFDFVEITPQRRLRVIHLKPFQNNGFTGEVSAETDHEEDTDEEYWFENAAPKRLPVIQPQPQPQQNRIINKFEPREPQNVESPSKNFHDNFISPGRLPRKTLSRQLLETDDFEDDQTVATTTGEELSESESPDQKKKINTNLSGLEQMSEILLEITAEGTAKKVKKMNTARSVSPSSISSSRSASPDTAGAADDSLHPSPELPHRSVCVRPDAVDSAQNNENDASIIIAGGNLGGVANKGFTQEDEEMDDLDKSSEEEIAASPEPEPSQVDAGYSRNRDPAALIASLDVTDNSVPGQEDKTEDNTASTEEQPPILFFIHGVGGSADSWSSQLAYFVSQGYEVIAPDLLGHGFSSCPDNPKAYTFTKLFKDLLTIFDTYVPEDRKCIIFGHSYGCSFTTALTRVRLERVVTLVLIASGGPTPLAPAPVQSKYPKCVKNILKTVMECKYKSQQNKYSPRGKTIKYRETFDIPRYVLNHIAAGALWPEGDAALHRRITVPTLLVYGMRDDLVSLVEECEMERTLPRYYQLKQNHSKYLVKILF